MCSTLMGMDVIGKADHIFMIGCGVLHSYFNCDTIHLTIRIDRCFKNRILIFIQEFDIGSNSAFVMIILGLLQAITFVDDRKMQTTIKKGQFLNPFIQLGKVKFGGFGKDFWIRCEVNSRSSPVCAPYNL